MYIIFISASIVVYIYIYTLGSSCLPACYDIILPSTYTVPLSYYPYKKNIQTFSTILQSLAPYVSRLLRERSRICIAIVYVWLPVPA